MVKIYSGTRPKTPATIQKTDSGIDRDSPILNATAATREATLLLSDRQWHKKADIDRIARKHCVDLYTLLDYLLAAESRRYVCLPGDNTPTESPDNTD